MNVLPGSSSRCSGLQLRRSRLVARRVVGAARRHSVRVSATVEVDKKSETSKDSTPAATDKSKNGSDSETTEARAARIKAVAAKISAARQLARKLSDEKLAVMAASDARQAEMLKRQAQLKSTEAAVAAAKADSINRLAQKGAAPKRDVDRLAAENDALTTMLAELAANNASLKERLEEVKTKFRAPRGAAARADPQATVTVDLPAEQRPTEAAAPAPAPAPAAASTAPPKTVAPTASAPPPPAPPPPAPSSPIAPSSGLDLLDKLKEMVTRGTTSAPSAPPEAAAQKAAPAAKAAAPPPPTAPPSVSKPSAAVPAPKAKSPAPTAPPPPVRAAAPPAPAPTPIKTAPPTVAKAPTEVKSPPSVAPAKPPPAAVPAPTARAPVAPAKPVAPVAPKDEAVKLPAKAPPVQPSAAATKPPVASPAPPPPTVASKAAAPAPPSATRSAPPPPPPASKVAPPPAPVAPTAVPRSTPISGPSSLLSSRPPQPPPKAAPAVAEQAVKQPEPLTPATPPKPAPSAEELERARREAERARMEVEARQAAEAEARKRREAAEARAKREAVLRSELARLQAEAQRYGDSFFTNVPPRPGTKVTLYVDTSRTVFRDYQPSQLELKLGWNKWETIEQVPLSRSGELCAVGPTLMSCELKLPEDLFGLEFVMMDPQALRFDNKDGQDHHMRLVDAPSEEEVIMRRVMAYEAAEKRRLEQIEAEEAKIWEEVLEESRAASDAAVEAWWADRRKALEEEAKAVVSAALSPSSPHVRERLEGVYFWLEGPPKPGSTGVIIYNRDTSELRHCSALSLHLGCNGWAGQTKQVYDMTKSKARVPAGGQWYEATVEIPAHAAVLDFVLSDAAGRVWDNNRGADYHSPVAPLSAAERAAAEDRMLEELTEKTHAANTVRARLAGVKAAEKIEAKAKAFAKRRALQRKTIYTQPPVPRAGEKVSIFYNPDVTSLRGRPEVWLRGSFNRWIHPTPIGPTRLEPAFPGNIGFMQAKLQVPNDAKVIDMVFSDSGSVDGGFYDNNNGLDYHVPVAGGNGKLKQLKVTHIAVEMAPIAKVGGMGDVVTALGRAVADEGHEVEVIIPKYDCLKYNVVGDMREEYTFDFNFVRVKVWRGTVEGLPTIFLEPDNGMFWVGCIYGRRDDADRFNFFCQAALHYLRTRPDGKSDVVHCHDWQTAPVAFGDRGGAQCVFTIHNLNYGADLIGKAMQACQVATTVSPTYAREISGNPAISPHLGKMYGVRNGIDVDIWDPVTDELLPMRYDSKSVREGKRAAKQQLQRRMNISPVDAPLVGVVTRLTHQKGIHLIKHAAWRTLERGGQFVLLGSAPDPKVQADFEALAGQLAHQYNDRARLCFSFDEPLSHLMYAGCDMLCVPSMFEPCGLTQLIAMRYGTVPVVRKTGGLNDTVFDVDDDWERAEQCGMQVNGYNFEGTDNAAMDYALNRALSSWWNDRESWHQLEERIMQIDWSWNEPAQDYVEIYYKAIKWAP